MVSYKDFAAWAKVAQHIENNKSIDCTTDIKPGAVYWFHFGVGIGTEVLGKGRNFTRPGLVLALLTNDLLLAVPTTSQPKSGPNYEKVMINGELKYLVLNQTCPVSRLRIMGFVDEIDPDTFQKIKRRYMGLRERQLNKIG